MRIFKIMSKNARAFRATIGMSLQQFNFLMRDVEKAYPEAERKRLEHPGRVRGVGAGRPFSLHPWDRVLLVLMYYRTYLTQDGMTHLFGISQGSISTNIGKMIPIIRECLPVPQKLYWQARKAATVEGLNELFPGLVALTDASEQPVQQPMRADMEESHYSAKAKTHTVKVQYTPSFGGLVVHKTAHSPGRRHDFKVYKMKHPTFPDNLPCGNAENAGRFDRNCLRHYGDTAYIAMRKVVPGLDSTTPIKRKPGKDLTPNQREYNRAHSRIRIRVENAIRRIKTFRIMNDRYRNRLGRYDRINDIVCGVVNQTILMKRAGTL